MKTRFGLALSMLLFTGLAAPAFAQVDEVRVGIAKHDLRWFDPVPSLEPSVAIQAEAIFEKPDFFKWKFAPKPYVAGTLNLGGETSYGGAGFVWRQGLGDNFYGDFAFGLVIHDGNLDTPRIEISPEFRAYTASLDPMESNFDDPILRAGFDQIFAESDRLFLNTIEYGSRVLFREQLTLGYRIDDKWAAEAFFEHLSHGGLLSDGRNDGSDAGGFRVARRF